MNIEELANNLHGVSLKSRKSIQITDECLNNGCCSCADNIEVSKFFADMQNNKVPPANKNYKWECKIIFDSVGGANIELRLSLNQNC